MHGDKTVESPRKGGDYNKTMLTPDGAGPQFADCLEKSKIEAMPLDWVDQGGGV
jgi:hypothetical protein